MESLKPKLSIVTLPIGNFFDLSDRTKSTLKNSDWIIAEEWKPVQRLLSYLKIQKEVLLLNEHSKKKDFDDLLIKVQNSKFVSLVSDAGSPLIEDPGIQLVDACIKYEIHLEVIPGPTALITALVLSGFPSSPFTFLGFLAKDQKQRRIELNQYLKIEHSFLFYETPYRINHVLEDLLELISPNRKIFLGLNLTMKNEFVLRGFKKDFLNQLGKIPKGLPVIVIGPNSRKP